MDIPPEVIKSSSSTHLKPMKVQCLKVSFKHRKLFLGIVGYSLKELLQNKNLIREIIKTLGHQASIEEFQEPDVFDVSLENEHPDYYIELRLGRIKILDYL